MSKQVNYNENLCAGAAIRDDKGRRISKLFEASHPKMTVGYARNLIMPSAPEEQEFNFRQSGGGVIEDGVAVIDKVKGNSVVWNQIIAKPYTFGDNRNFTFTSWFHGGSRSINDKGQFIFITNGGTEGVGNSLSIIPKNTHKYLLSYKVKADIASVCKIYKKGSSNVIANIAEADKWYFVSCIDNNVDTSNFSSFLNAVVAANSPETTVTIDDAQVIDLTQMFGAGNEPSTYEEYLQRKPKVADEFAYNEGTIVNNKVEKVVTTGRNLWDEEWEVGSIKISTGEDISAQDRIRMKGYLPVLPNTSYYCTLMNVTGGNGYFCYYDQNKKFIAYNGNSSHYEMNKVFTTPSNCYFVRFYLNVEYGKTYNHDVCINLSDPSINGKYFPYEEHALDLSWVKDIKDTEGVKLFEDGMRSAGTAFDEVGAKKATKRIGVVDLGSLSGWEIWNGQRFSCVKPSFLNAVQGFGYIKPNAMTTKYECKGSTSMDDNEDMIMSFTSLIYVRDSSFSYDAEGLEKFKTAIQGVKLIYELAEPIEVEYDEKSLTYPVVAGGTEEAIASEPSTAFRADIGYGIDAVKTILDLKARVEALEGK